MVQTMRVVGTLINFALYEMVRQLSVLNKVRDNRGYLIAEMYLQLVILFVVASSIGIYFSVLQSFSSSMNEVSSQTAELFIYELEQDLSRATAVKKLLADCSIQLTIAADHVQYEKYASMIRKRKNNLGHEPLLLNVKSCKFQVESNVVLVQLELQDNTKIVREIYYD